MVASFFALVALRVAIAAQEPVYLGVVREDGLLLPFAIHDGREWWNAWPYSYEDDPTVTELPLPASLAAIPRDWLPPGLRLPPTWTLHPLHGKPGPVQLRGFARSSRSSLSSFIAIQTSYKRRPRAEIMDEASEVGVAIAGAARLWTVERVDSSGAEHRQLRDAVLRPFNDAEASELARQSTAVRLPTAAEREKTPLIEFSVTKTRTSTSGESVYFVSAMRDYGASPYPYCDLSVAMSAFVTRTVDGVLHVRNAGAWTPLECGRDFVVADGLDVLAALEWRGARLWIVRVGGGEGGIEYGLLDPLAADPSVVPLKGAWRLRPR